MRKWWLIVGALAAAKLGVDAQALEDALTEAWEEVRAERQTQALADAEQRLHDYLDERVEAGTITRRRPTGGSSGCSRGPTRV